MSTGCESKPDGGSCGCRVEEQGFAATLVMSWEMLLAKLTGAATGSRRFAPISGRIDTGCGLTVLRLVPAGGPIDSVFDSSVPMVGGLLASDTATYRCPSNSAIEATKAARGTFPFPDCDERSWRDVPHRRALVRCR